MAFYSSEKIRALYKDALAMATIKDEPFMTVVFDKGDEGLAARQLAMAAFNATHYTTLTERDDCIEINLTPDQPEAEQYPVLYLPIAELQEDGSFKEYPEYEVLCDMARVAPQPEKEPLRHIHRAVNADASIAEIKEYLNAREEAQRQSEQLPTEELPADQIEEAHLLALKNDPSIRELAEKVLTPARWN